MRRSLALLVVALAALPAAADWGPEARRYEEALRSDDLAAWTRALRGLRGQDHPAAVELLLRFHAAHPSRAKAWRVAHPRSRSSLVRAESDRLFAGLLAGARSVRSIRFLASRLGEPVARPLVVAVLARNPALHVVGEELRESLRDALRAGDDRGFRARLALLRGRLHVGDRAWIREAAASARVPATLREELLRAYPDAELRLELLGDGETEERGRLARIVEEARLVESVLGSRALTARDEALAEAIEALGLTDAAGSVGVAYRRRLRALLAHEALADLPALHRAAVRLRAERALRRDRLLYPGAPRLPGDRAAFRRAADAKLRIDLDAPTIAAEVRVVEMLRRWLAAREVGPPGAPYHPALLELNVGGKRDADTAAFSPEERDRRELLEEVRRTNRAHGACTAAERANVALVNDYREHHGLRPLRIDADLVRSARGHSRFQAAAGVMAHSFPPGAEPQGRTPQERMARAGYPVRYVGGENVLVGSRDPREAFGWWRKSPGHRRNMLSPAWTEIGVAEHGGYWTQNFGSEPYDEDHDR